MMNPLNSRYLGKRNVYFRKLSDLGIFHYGYLEGLIVNIRDLIDFGVTMYIITILKREMHTSGT